MTSLISNNGPQIIEFVTLQLMFISLVKQTCLLVFPPGLTYISMCNIQEIQYTEAEYIALRYTNDKCANQTALVQWAALWENRLFTYAKKKDADQFCGNREADQRLCFRYLDSTIPLLSKSKISSL